ncbi:cation efflux family-domain-containing protein [Chaetomium fimeti]|uniref:Zinc transporter n=1 Tax=Chaetomium fimeti TaxID=1854472 RepID=A0AAE0HMP2_9PEZI|nr:cation efflux family-domain-containing protein [Chaetomium fimeti]
MAPSQFLSKPQGTTPPTPAIVAPDENPGEPSFQFTCDDYDHDRDHDHDHDRDHQTTIDPPVANTPERRPSLSPAALLHPHHSPSLRPPTPESTFAMATEDGLANVGSNGPTAKNPFNFQTQFISAGPVKSNIGQRRGHRYKHSSISAQHQIFQEPPPRPPPVLPASLPIPTLREAWASMQSGQRARLWWCCCHAAVAMYVFFGAEGSLAMTALSHLVFFDVGSAAVCVAVDVLGNFEVWRRSSIRHPFGLQRAEVLAGFAMSVFLVFGGFDLISHNLKHFLETVGEHAPHHPSVSSTTHPSGGEGPLDSHGHTHSARYITPGTVDFTCLAAVVSTLVSAYGLRNHGRIRRVMRVPFPYLARLLPGAGILANPFHFLTLCFSFLMLLLPLLSVPHLVWLDRLICAAIAASMFVLGTRLAVAQGLMLLMSYSDLSVSPTSGPATTAATSSSNNAKPALTLNNNSGSRNPNKNDSATVSSVVREIEAEPHVARVEEAQFWQVHYGLGMANLKVRVAKGGSGVVGGGGGGADEDGALSQLRSRLARVVQNRLGEGYGRGGNLRWEVTVQTCSSDG